MQNRLSWLAGALLFLVLGCEVAEPGDPGEADRQASGTPGFTIRGYSFEVWAKNLPPGLGQGVRLRVTFQNLLKARLYKEQCFLVPDGISDPSAGTTVNAEGFTLIAEARGGMLYSLGTDVGSNFPVWGNVANLVLTVERGTFTEHANTLADLASHDGLGVPLVAHFNSCREASGAETLFTIVSGFNQNSQATMTYQDWLQTFYSSVIEVDFLTGEITIKPKV
ncbi:MAG: hypothetical protein V1748_09955 [Actinomycetota bacterium]